ncbi:fimbrial protein [Serratia rubidaea]|uniref:fimbrial protein n=1 Tax=Serratia rubidaea TaxID=61652 RepID=UPI0022B937E7|nr:fimbrial protein [Serratia rubidaea]WBF46157.1 fimbrial protein [Serratia rubidaea]
MHMKRVLTGSLLAILGLFSMAAQATCTFLSGSATDGETINFGNVTVQRDTPVGAVVASTSPTAFSSRDSFVRCVGTTVPTMRWSAEGTTTVRYNGEQLFSVGISGLAMRVVNPAGPYGLNFTGDFSRDAVWGGCTAGPTGRSYCGAAWGGATRFELVKVAAVTGSGRLNILGRIRASIVNETYVYAFNFGASDVSTVACSVSSSSINVPMGSVKQSEFTGVGYKTEPTQFFIPLSCDTGTRVNITIDATADVSGFPGVMAIDPVSTGTAARGVGIEVADNRGMPVRFGTLIPLGTYTEASGNVWFPFTARYYQTGAQVYPGVANGTATFTMTYN